MRLKYHTFIPLGPDRLLILTSCTYLTRELMYKVGFFLSVTALTLMVSCHRKLPDTIYKAFYLDWELVEAEDTVYFQASNPLACPLVFTVLSSNKRIIDAFGDQIPRIIAPYEDISLPMTGEWSEEEVRSQIDIYALQSRMQPVVPDTSVKYVYPFRKGRSYNIIQGYGGEFSHRKSAFAYYALDFEIPVGDTVCAARDGVVVGLIEGNKNWVHGPHSKYREYANYLRLYHADETYTDYVHLKYRGALVALGDTVRAGQPIGISGYTGWTSTPHLHFNAVMPTDSGTLVGFPIQFEKMAGRDLKVGTRAGHD